MFTAPHVYVGFVSPRLTWALHSFIHTNFQNSPEWFSLLGCTSTRLAGWGIASISSSSITITFLLHPKAIGRLPPRSSSIGGGDRAIQAEACSLVDSGSDLTTHPLLVRPPLPVCPTSGSALPPPPLPLLLRCPGAAPPPLENVLRRAGEAASGLRFTDPDMTTEAPLDELSPLLPLESGPAGGKSSPSTPLPDSEALDRLGRVGLGGFVAG